MLSTLVMRPDAIAWQVAGTLTQPVFDGWNLQGQYDLQKGRYSELAALYRKQILTALSDTENALIAIRETDRQMKFLAVAVSAARRALDAVEMRLREGTIDIVQLAQTQTTYFQTRGSARDRASLPLPGGDEPVSGARRRLVADDPRNRDHSLQRRL